MASDQQAAPLHNSASAPAAGAVRDDVPREARVGTTVRTPLLVVFLLVLVVITGTYIGGGYYIERTYLKEQAVADTQTVKGLFNNSIGLAKAELEKVLISLGARYDFADQLRLLDKEGLFASSQFVYLELNDTQSVEWLTFLDMKLDVVLDINDTKTNTDTSKRAAYVSRTAEAAHATGHLVSDINVMPTGEVAVIAVTPVFQLDEIVGYLEIGKPLTSVVASVHESLGVRSFLTVDKGLVDRKAWEETQITPELRDLWHALPNQVPVSLAGKNLAKMLQYQDLSAANDASSVMFLTDGRKEFTVSGFPLIDGEKQTIGAVNVIHDYSKMEQTFIRERLLFLAVSLLVTAAAFVFFLDTLKRVTRKVENAYDNLETLIDERTFELSHSKENLVAAQSIARLGSWEWDIPADRMHCSAEMYKIIGLPEDSEPLTYTKYSACLHPDDLVVRTHAITEAMQTDGQFFAQFRMMRDDGSVIHVEERGRISFGPDNEPVRFNAIVQDVTDQKIAEDMTRRLANIMEESFNEIYVFDAKTLHFIQANKRALENLGYTADELRERTAYDIKPEFTREEFIEEIRPLTEGEASHLTFETVHQRRDGSTYPVEVRLQQLTSVEPPVFFAIINDISERQESEKTQKMLANAIEALPISVALFDRDDRLVMANEYTKTHTSWRGDMLVPGVTFEEIIRDCDARGIRPAIDGSSDDWVEKRLEQHRKGEGNVLNKTKDGRVLLGLEKRMPDGNSVTIRFDVTELKAAEEEVKKLNADLEKKVEERTDALRDEMRERQETQEALRDSEERTRQIMDTAADGIVTIGEDGLIRSFNRAAEAIFGHAAEDAIGRNVSMLMPGPIAEKHDGYLARYLKTSKSRIIGRAGEFQGMRASGEEFPMELAISETKTREGSIFSGIIRDITERKAGEKKLRDTLSELRHAQAELVQAEKLASLGGLVAGVAHEINTPIGIGVTAVSHLEESVLDARDRINRGELRKSDLTKHLETAEQSTKILASNLRRAADLISSFKQVAVDQSSQERRSFDVGEYLEEILLSLRPQIKKTPHEVTTDAPSGLFVESYPGALSQVVTNLVLNSINHAFDDGDVGHIHIKVRERQNEIALSYQDDGKGMDADTLRQLYDPFFTTKRGKGGSGLGMNIVHNLVVQTLGGTITAQSAPSKGVQFEIVFPKEVKEVKGSEHAA